VIAGAPFPFGCPLLVCIITDGVPQPEHWNVFLGDEIVECKTRLKERGYDPTAVMFCISQVGTGVEATKFIDALRNEEIEDVIYCTVGHLESRFKELKGNERALESWLLHILTKPIMDRH